LKRARELAAEARRLHAEGVDPIERRREQRSAVRVEQAKAVTVRQCAEAYVAAHEAGWRSAKHANQWAATLATYVYPVIGSLPVAAVDTALTLKIIEPLWKRTPETASRTRQRIEVILDAAKARGLRDGENPARWKGHLSNLLPPRSKVQRVKHFPAMTYAELPSFMAGLRAQTSTRSRCLEFAILCAARTNEALGVRWDEIDLEQGVWTAPAARTKGGRAHRVPLSERVVAILREQQARREGDYVFPGRFGGGAPLSATSLLDALHATGRTDVTAHGFRATFRTWAAERTSFQREVIEAALAHIVGDETERAYQRGDLFDKRRRLMDAWAEFCGQPARISNKIVNMNSRVPA
jgi:integrase